MSLALATALIVLMVITSIAAVVGVPLLFGALAFEVLKERKSATAATAPTPAPALTAGDTSIRIAAKRGVARAFVLAGGLFWSVTLFVGLYVYQQSGMREAALAALYPAAGALAALIIGWYFERVTAALLALGTIAVVAWGVIYQFEAGVWAIMTFALIGPMLTAAVLFWLARSDQDAYERQTALKPDLGILFSARSSAPARVPVS